MSSVLVTGGTGFIGSWVTRQLVDQGVRVVTYSRHPDTALIKDIADKVDCVAGDVLDLPRLIHTIKHYGVERIIHMSTLLIGPLEANPFMAYRVNVDGTMNILEAARLMDIKRVVFISSKAAYDIAGVSMPLPLASLLMRTILRHLKLYTGQPSFLWRTWV